MNMGVKREVGEESSICFKVCLCVCLLALWLPVATCGVVGITASMFSKDGVPGPFSRSYVAIGLSIRAVCHHKRFSGSAGAE